MFIRPGACPPLRISVLLPTWRNSCENQGGQPSRKLDLTLKKKRVIRFKISKNNANYRQIRGRNQWFQMALSVGPGNFLASLPDAVAGMVEVSLRKALSGACRVVPG